MKLKNIFQNLNELAMVLHFQTNKHCKMLFRRDSFPNFHVLTSIRMDCKKLYFSGLLYEKLSYLGTSFELSTPWLKTAKPLQWVRNKLLTAGGGDRAGRCGERRDCSSQILDDNYHRTFEKTLPRTLEGNFMMVAARIIPSGRAIFIATFSISVGTSWKRCCGQLCVEAALHWLHCRHSYAAITTPERRDYVLRCHLSDEQFIWSRSATNLL